MHHMRARTVSLHQSSAGIARRSASYTTKSIDPGNSSFLRLLYAQEMCQVVGAVPDASARRSFEVVEVVEQGAGRDDALRIDGADRGVAGLDVIDIDARRESRYRQQVAQVGEHGRVG